MGLFGINKKKDEIILQAKDDLQEVVYEITLLQKEQLEKKEAEIKQTEEKLNSIYSKEVTEINIKYDNIISRFDSIIKILEKHKNQNLEVKPELKNEHLLLLPKKRNLALEPIIIEQTEKVIIKKEEEDDI